MAGLESTRLGDYELIERLGSGGMAEVYRALQPKAFNREVAVKVIRPAYSEDPMFRARFLREGQAISRLSHPNILQLIECDEQNGILYLVMPLARGGTLKDLIKAHNGPMELSEVVPLFTQLCEAVQFAHDQGIIHRDIKPPNVLLLNRNTVMLADFGIARDDAETRLTTTGAGMGTVEYMAPEQAIGEATARSDIYSLGVVLYQMLTGIVPYSGSTPMQIMLNHREKPLRDPRVLNPGLPAAVAAVIQTALAKDPRERFGSPKALATALAQAARIGQPMNTPQPTYQPELPETVKVSPGNVPGAAAGSGVVGPTVPVPPPAGPVPPWSPPSAVVAPPPSQPQTPPRKPRSVLIGLILAVVIVLGGLGIGGYLLFFNHAVLYQASLTSPTSGWDCLTYDTNNSPFTSTNNCSFHSDGYHLSVTNGYAYTVSALTTQTYANAVIEVTYTILATSQPDNYFAVAIGLRDQQNNRDHLYALEITPNGSYAFFVDPALPQAKTLIQAVQSNLIQQGLNQANTLKIVMNGSQFTLYANGQQLTTSPPDSTYSVGYIGFAAINAGAEVVFSNLTVTSS